MLNRLIRRPASILALALAAPALAGVGLVTPLAAEAAPTFVLRTVATGLTHPWDVTWVGGVMVFDERGGGLWSQRSSGAPRRVTTDLPAAYISGEGGRLGLVADPDAADNQRFYLCQTYRTGSTPVDVRVLRLRLTSDTTAQLDRRSGDGGVVVKGLPLSTGRHSGCRLRFGGDGALYVGTGDAAQGTAPQSRRSLGGKVLRVKGDGTIPTDNPFYGEGGNARYIWSYGHRNVQGLALRPGTAELWTAEHGSSRDDEVNVSVRGGNYGWDPVPGYDESTPMTDTTKFPSAVRAAWRSGSPTVATSGLTFLTGSRWGRWEGALAVGLLKGQGIEIHRLDPRGAIIASTRVAGLGRFDRIRTVQSGPGGALYFTTSNGSGRDVIATLTPTADPPTVKAGTNVARYAVSAVRTGGDIYAVSRTGSGRVVYKRSTDDGATWSRAWTSTGLRSTIAPGVASSAPGRLDLVTGSAGGAVTHSWFTGGTRRGSTALGGPRRTATVSSLGDGTLDVWGLRTTGGVYRRHFDGQAWSGWRKLTSGGYSSMVGAAADPATGRTRLTVRGTTGRIHERTVTAASDGAPWAVTGGLLWSGRAFGDRVAGQPLVAASRASDGYLRLQRDQKIIALGFRIGSDPDVVTRPDGSWLVFARSAASDNMLVYDSATRRLTDLGGQVG